MRRIDGFALWIGTARDARDIKCVLDTGLEAVVDLALMCEPVRPTRELVYLRFPLVDGADNPQWCVVSAVRAVESLVRFDVPTLVACDGGMSRSLVVAAAALALVTTRPPDEMLARVAASGAADVHPRLWDDVKRFVFGAQNGNEAR